MLLPLWLLPALPLASFLLLAFVGRRMSLRAVAIAGTAPAGMAAVIAIILAGGLIGDGSGTTYAQTIWQWVDVDGVAPAVAFYFDSLAAIMSLTVTFVSFLILLYSVEYMRDDEGYARFFCYMNLFVGAMLILVLADNLLLLLIGWEGVGLCSYLLIGFWYRDPANGRAARKAFIVTRMGDTALLIGILLIVTNLGTLNIQDVLEQASRGWPAGSSLVIVAAALLLGGALGKSAQIPLQTWLPDAMAGPTPVSALIHAATMVTAGVYLIARMHVLFALAPAILLAVALIGAGTLLYAGFSALTQSDLKRALAYSTMSQIGYMFLALGVGAWPAAIFHVMTHAFFKALLFLAAGVIILALHHEQNMFRMGGLRKQIPLAFWTFLIGASSLAALPLVTAGFYSKDLILIEAWQAQPAGRWLWAAGLGGALLTAVYSFRMVFLVFFGPRRQAVNYTAGVPIRVPLIVLSILSIIAGVLELPKSMGSFQPFSDFLSGTVGQRLGEDISVGTEVWLELTSAAASLAGIYLAYQLFCRRRLATDEVRAQSGLLRFWQAGWGFDALYQNLIVGPFVWLAQTGKDDVVDRVYQGVVLLARQGYGILSRTESGQVRWYATGIALGAVVLIAIGIFG